MEDEESSRTITMFWRSRQHGLCSGPGSIFQIKRQRKQKDNMAWFLLMNHKHRLRFVATIWRSLPGASLTSIKPGLSSWHL